MYPIIPDKPEMVSIPCATYIMIRGNGAWDDPKGSFFTASKTLRAIHKELTYGATHLSAEIRHSYLEAFWWQQVSPQINPPDKNSYIWTVAMQVGTVCNDEFYAAQQTVAAQHSTDCSNVFLSTISEGSCAQILHVGSYENEVDTLAKLQEFIDSEGYEINPFGFSPCHEIYIPLSEAGKHGQWDTVVRWPICCKRSNLSQ